MLKVASCGLLVVVDNTMIRLLLVESQAAIRRGLRMRLTLEPDVTVIGEARDGLAALWQASILRPDVILVDTESADMDGVRLIAALRSVSPESAAVILSLRDDAATRRRLLAAGAVAFVSKHDHADRLLHAIRQAATAGQLPPGRALPAGGLTPARNDGSLR